MTHPTDSALNPSQKTAGGTPPTDARSVAVIVGSAFDHESLGRLDLRPVDVDTAWGRWRLFRVASAPRPAWLSFRHGSPHTLLPNQIPYRAQAAALDAVGCRGLLVTSSVGVLRAHIPLDRALVLGDLITLDNRLPDGSACSMFAKETTGQGHLVLNGGLFSRPLSAQVMDLARRAGAEPVGEVIFGYVGGPRTKTPAENRMWAAFGADVNSMTVGPEVVLANELGIPCAGVAVGHKYSIPGVGVAPTGQDMTRTLTDSREHLARIIESFALEAIPVEFENLLYRYDQHAAELAAHIPERRGATVGDLG